MDILSSKSAKYKITLNIKRQQPITTFIRSSEICLVLSQRVKHTNNTML